MVFSLDVMEHIQKKYGSFVKWADRCFGAAEYDGEPDTEALRFGLMEMLNEGITIENEDTGGNTPLLTPRQVTRIATAIGLTGLMDNMNDLITRSTDTGEKN